MKLRKTSTIVSSLAALTILVSACSGTGASGVSDVDQNKELGSIEGVEINPDTVPTMGCTDGSYAEAVNDGVIVGMSEFWPSFTSEGGEYRGLDYDIVKSALTYAGIDNVEWHIGSSYDELVPSLLSKRIDIEGMVIHATAERATQIAFTTGAYSYGPAIAVGQGNPSNIQTYADLERPGLRIGVTRGGAPASYLEARGVEIMQFDDPVAQLNALASGQTDASLEDAPVVQPFVAANPGLNLEVLEPEVPMDLVTNGYDYARYATRKEDCSLNMALSRAITELSENGVIAELVAKYPGNRVHVSDEL